MKKYQPSNGTEGMWFTDRFCHQCERDRKYRETDEPDFACKILTNTLVYDTRDDKYPEEWICDDNYEEPVCTAFLPEIVKDDPADKSKGQIEKEYREKAEKHGQLRLTP